MFAEVCFTYVTNRYTAEVLEGLLLLTGISLLFRVKVLLMFYLSDDNLVYLLLLVAARLCSSSCVSSASREILDS